MNMKEFFFSPKSKMVFQGSLKGVSIKYQGCFMPVSRVFQESFGSLSRKIEGFLRKFLGDISRAF